MNHRRQHHLRLCVQPAFRFAEVMAFPDHILIPHSPVRTCRRKQYDAFQKIGFALRVFPDDDIHMRIRDKLAGIIVSEILQADLIDLHRSIV